MPKYELMYIVGSHISDDEIPAAVEAIKNAISKAGGTIQKHEDLGKKKLAYPIKKTRNGNYVLVQFELPAEKISDIEHELRTTPAIIRHLIINVDEALVRMAKDREAQAKIAAKRPAQPEERDEKETAPEKETDKKIEIDLDAEIEKALEPEDLK